MLFGRNSTAGSEKQWLQAEATNRRKHYPSGGRRGCERSPYSKISGAAAHSSGSIFHITDKANFIQIHDSGSRGRRHPTVIGQLNTGLGAAVTPAKENS